MSGNAIETEEAVGGRDETPREDRVLVLTPMAADALAIRRILAQGGFPAEVCRDVEELSEHLGLGGGAVVVAEEALPAEARAMLGRAFLRQPPWSDLPLLVLVSYQEDRNPWAVLRGMEGAGHVVFLERPLRTSTFLSAVQAALEARQRQYQVRDELASRQEAEEELRRVNQELGRLNQELEERVRERTRALAESESKYRGLVENTGDVPFSLDAEGRIRYIGPQVERYGFQREDLTGLHLLQVVSAADRRRATAAFRRMMASGEAEEIDFRVRPAQGEDVWLEERGKVLRDRFGGFMGLTGVLRDVTEWKKAEALRARREEQLRELAGRLAEAKDEEQRRIGQGLHNDVAQLLSACTVKLALLDRAESSAQRAAMHREIQDLLEEATEELRSLSFELYSSTLSRLGLGAALGELCEVMGARFGIELEVKGLEAAESVDEAAGTVLFKSVRELLFNVVQHAQVDEATVVIQREGDLLRVTVEDHGVGFPKRPDGARIDLGRGLGLFSIRERLEGMGGGIRIESDPGVLTRVSIWVPVAPLRAEGPS